jgi:isopentenyl diphosphate isomerase/L-lactate dehydrogenase-like FMN-dependent dehydrogenase
MQPINLFEYEPLAKARLDPAAYDYYAGGAEDELTLRENRAAYARIKLRPRVLVDVSRVATGTTVLGVPVGMPILVPPMAYQRLAAPEGELATARAAGDAGTIMAVSTLATASLEEIAGATSGPLWFQLYVYKDRTVSEALVRRAEVAGYRALVLTVDTPLLGRREADERNGFGLPAHLHMSNFAGRDEARPTEPGVSALALHTLAEFDPSLTWEALDWMRSITRLPVVVKGILTHEDADLAARHGAAGVVVSNHGGRQLDTAVATIEALPEVAEAVAGRCEVYVDGGIRRGTDVLKALALGARAVLIGRPVLWGLGAGGSDGVIRMVDLIRGELVSAMGHTGVTSARNVPRDVIVRQER